MHGSWIEQATIAQRLKAVLHAADGWTNLHGSQREALEMVCVKISRIVTGDPQCLDHWHDAQGYLRLGEPK